MRLLIVGNREGTNVGGSLERAAAAFGIDVRLCPTAPAWGGPRLAQRICWRLARLPLRLERYSAEVLAVCRSWCPDVLISTGNAPLTAAAVAAIGRLGVRRINFSTDDPWSPVHRARWFLRALPRYDLVFTPRRANQADLQALGCPACTYLPFGYDPLLHFPEPDAAADDDVVFVGGADHDRLPYMRALGAAGVRTSLYGRYWERFAPTRPFNRGMADPAIVRQATSAAKVALCLVRRSNRDGHVMRSFEIPAVGGCMLAEDTAEHRAIFGDDGEAVRYFRDPPSMLAALHELLAAPAERARLAHAAHCRITAGGNRYADRLQAMLKLCEVL